MSIHCIHVSIVSVQSCGHTPTSQILGLKYRTTSQQADKLSENVKLQLTKNGISFASEKNMAETDQWRLIGHYDHVF